MRDEDAHDRVGDRATVLGFADDACAAGDVAMSGDSAEQQTKPDAWLAPAPIADQHGLETDVVGLFQCRNTAAAIEGDVELARQAVQRAIIEDVIVPFARQRPRVAQFLWIDAGGRRSRDVADVVGARAARAQTEVLHRLDDMIGVIRLHLPNLQVGARRHMRIAAAEPLATSATPANCQWDRIPLGMRSRHM